MRIKKDDTVKVLSGKDRGKTGKVIQAFPEIGRVVVEGVNQSVRHLKTRARGQAGQRVEYSSPINASNVLLICPKCSKATRIGGKLLVEGDKKRKARVCRKCNEVIE